ncbi:MAG: NifU family protein [Bdellovibrionales bacterium]
MITINQDELIVQTMETPNPSALKFIVNVSLKTDGKATFNTVEECQSLPMLEEIFRLPGVKQVHVFQNTLTVTHSGELDPSAVDENVTSILKSRINQHNPDFDSNVTEKKASHRTTSDDPQIQAIEEILDRTVRPGLQADGGDVEILSFEGNELKILYQGACGGCPSAMMGTLDAIQGILRNELGNEALFVTPVEAS